MSILNRIKKALERASHQLLKEGYTMGTHRIVLKKMELPIGEYNSLVYVGYNPTVSLILNESLNHDQVIFEFHLEPK